MYVYNYIIIDVIKMMYMFLYAKSKNRKITLAIMLCILSLIYNVWLYD